MTAQSTAPLSVPFSGSDVTVGTVRSIRAIVTVSELVPWTSSPRSVYPAPGVCVFVRMAAAPTIVELGWVVVTLNEYALLSVPLSHAPFTPFELPATANATGFVEATPEYLDTTIKAVLGALANVAVTVPVEAEPIAHQTSIPV